MKDCPSAQMTSTFHFNAMKKKLGIYEGKKEWWRNLTVCVSDDQTFHSWKSPRSEEAERSLFKSGEISSLFFRMPTERPLQLSFSLVFLLSSSRKWAFYSKSSSITMEWMVIIPCFHHRFEVRTSQFQFDLWLWFCGLSKFLCFLFWL